MRFNRRTVPVLTSAKFKEELVSMINDLMGNLAALFDRGVGLTDNIDGVAVSYTSNAIANIEDAVAHTLGRVPTGYIVTSLDKAGVVYISGTAFTATEIYLKCNVATVAVKLIVF